MQIIEKEKCCGCSACFNTCPKNAIKMVKDKDDFEYPKIDKNKCINCGLCRKVCPVLQNNTIENNICAYAVYNKNEKERLSSSSGGIFVLLAKVILKENGIIYGACLDDDLQVKHIKVDKISDLPKLMGSKYVQSDINNSFRSVKEDLEKNKKVLFTGTPCQVEGLKSYLRKDYKNLYTQDIICHGVGFMSSF